MSLSPYSCSEEILPTSASPAKLTWDEYRQRDAQKVTEPVGRTRIAVPKPPIDLRESSVTCNTDSRDHNVDKLLECTGSGMLVYLEEAAAWMVATTDGEDLDAETRPTRVANGKAGLAAFLRHGNLPASVVQEAVEEDGRCPAPAEGSWLDICVDGRVRHRPSLPL